MFFVKGKIMANLDSKQFAPGVSVAEFATQTHFEGHAASLIEAGVINEQWLPGFPGNQKTCVTVVLDSDGNGFVAPPKSSAERCEGDFGYLRIFKSGNNFRVCKNKPWQERERYYAERRAACTSETWQINKELVIQQRDFPREWKQCVVQEARRAENLAKGIACFTGFPDIELSDADRKTILEAVDHLVLTINSTTPFLRQAKESDGNVIRLADHAHRGMRKAG